MSGEKNTVLTARQMQIVELRSSGMSTAEIAEAIGTGMKNVLILEARAHRKIESAAATLNALREGGIISMIRISTGTHLLDAVKNVLEAADKRKIKLNGSIIDLMASIRSFTGHKLANGIIGMEATVLIFPTGKWTLLS